MSNTLVSSARDSLEAAQLTYSELRSSFEQRLAALPDSATSADVDRIESEFRGQLSSAEASVTEARKRADTMSRIADARAHTGGLIPREDFSVSEPDMYREDGPESFFADLYRSEKGDRAARSRLQAHSEERARNTKESRAAWSDTSFYPPQWIEAAWVQARRQRRVVANLVTQAPLPAVGNTLEVPSYAGAAPTTAADVMAGDNQLVTSNSPGAASVLTATVGVYAGYLDIPRRLLERSLPGLDVVIFGDLANDINRHVDLYTLYGTGSGLQPEGLLDSASGILSVSYTDTIGATTFYSHLADAVQQIQTNAFESPDAVIMHPRRLAYFLKQVDTTGRPLMTPNQNGPWNSYGVVTSQNPPFGQDSPEQSEVRPSAWIMGIPCYADANITTTAGVSTSQDEILVGAFKNAWLWEDSAGIREWSFEGIASDHLNVRLQSALYGAFLNRFPKAFAKITGSSLTPPTF